MRSCAYVFDLLHCSANLFTSPASHFFNFNCFTWFSDALFDHISMASTKRTKINPREECWYMMESEWLYRWAEFIAGNKDISEVGRISTGEWT